MTLPVSPNSIGMDQVAAELGVSVAGLNLNDPNVRILAGVTGDQTTISMDFLRGKANMPAQTYYLYSSPGTYYFTVPNGPRGFSGTVIGGEGGGGGGGGAGEYNWNASAAGGSGGSAGMGEEVWFSAAISPGEVLTIVVGDGGYGGVGGFGHWTGLGTSGGYFMGDAGASGSAGQVSSISVTRGGIPSTLVGAGGGGGGGGGAGGINDNQYSVTRGGDGADGWPGGYAGSSNSGVVAGPSTAAVLLTSPTYRQGTGTGGAGGYWGTRTLTGDTSYQPKPNDSSNMFNADNRARISGLTGGNGAKGRVEFTLLRDYPNPSTVQQHALTTGAKYVAPSAGGGGGGGGGGCVSVNAILPDGMLAGQIEVGNSMMLADPETFEENQGVVTMSKPTLQPGFRLVTESGASLVCSETAPIPTRYGYVNPRELLGMEVPVRHDAEDGTHTIGWERITLVHGMGDIMVQHITVGDKCFWAGEKSGSYILHHNLKEVVDNYAN